MAQWNGGATGQWADNLAVYNCFFDGAIDIGIQMNFVWYPIISGCYFAEGVTFGIYQDPADGAILGARIHDNFFKDVVTSAISIEGEGCDIFQNYFFVIEAEAGAAATDRMIDLVNGSANLVHHNTMSCLLGAGAGAYDDCNTESGTDSWNQNYCIDGPTVARPL